MSKFYAVNRQTGERWKPTKNECLIMFDSGFLGVFSNDGYYQTVIPLSTSEWKTVVNFTKNWLDSRSEK